MGSVHIAAAPLNDYVILKYDAPMRKIYTFFVLFQHRCQDNIAIMPHLLLKRSKAYLTVHKQHL